MGASNRHGGMKLPRRIKIMFMKHPARKNVFRAYFGVRKSEPVATSTTAAPSSNPEVKQ